MLCDNLGVLRPSSKSLNDAPFLALPGTQDKQTLPLFPTLPETSEESCLDEGERGFGWMGKRLALRVPLGDVLCVTSYRVGLYATATQHSSSINL